MKIDEIKEKAQEYHRPGDSISHQWHPVYKKECEKINRKHLEKEIMKKYERFKSFV